MFYQLDQVLCIQALYRIISGYLETYSKATLWVFQYVNRNFSGCCFIWGKIFHNILYSILRNKLKGEFSVYFDFLLYFKYTWIFGKFSYNLFNFIVTINRFTNPLKLRIKSFSYFLSFSINVILEPPCKCLFEKYGFQVFQNGFVAVLTFNL